MNDQHSPTINLNAELDHRINFAMQQNDVPVVKTVHIANSLMHPYVSCACASHRSPTSLSRGKHVSNSSARD